MTKLIKFPKLLGLLAIASLTMMGCDNEETPYIERPVNDLYNQALDVLEKESYLEAAKAFDEVERQHPYSYWATKAQLMAAYSYYKGRAYERAIEALDAFIQLHPGHEDAAYAYYLKGFCYYHQLSVVERDQKMTELALTALKEVVRRFPDSAYARDAKLKIQLAKDHLAGKDMQVGRFYQKSHLPLAAINRFLSVAENYQATSHVPEALFRLVECYTSLGMFAEAKRSASILGHNYPGSQWYAEAYKVINTIDPKVMKESVTQVIKQQGVERIALPKGATVQKPEGRLDADAPPSVRLDQRPAASKKINPEEDDQITESADLS